MAAGDFGAVEAEKNAFILFNSGVYMKPKDKAVRGLSSHYIDYVNVLRLTQIYLVCGVWAARLVVATQNKAAATSATDKIFTAVAAKDKSGLQSAYAEFMKVRDSTFNAPPVEFCRLV